MGDTRENHGDEQRPAAMGQPASVSDGRSPAGGPRQHDIRTIGGSIWVLEHAQDIVTVCVGIVLIVLAAVLLVSAIYDFAVSVSGKTPILNEASLLLDRVLLVLILVEIVHTVALSLRAHRLIAQPFIIVGLFAVIRRILFVLTPGATGQAPVGTAELALLLAMVAVFIAGLIAVRRFEKREE